MRFKDGDIFSRVRGRRGWTKDRDSLRRGRAGHSGGVLLLITTGTQSFLFPES